MNAVHYSFGLASSRQIGSNPCHMDWMRTNLMPESVRTSACADSSMVTAVDLGPTPESRSWRPRPPHSCRTRYNAIRYHGHEVSDHLVGCPWTKDTEKDDLVLHILYLYDFRFVSLNSYPTYPQQRKVCLWTVLMLMKSIARHIFLQLQLLVFSHRRAVPQPARIVASPLIGTVPMTQKIQESMPDIKFLSAFASIYCLHVVGASARSGK